MKKIIISIVTIVYNDHNHIERTIHSVLDQDYPYIDYVIVDGASTDGTKECIYRYEAFLGTLISEPDKGIYDAMNKGLQAVKGNYLHGVIKKYGMELSLRTNLFFIIASF